MAQKSGIARSTTGPPRFDPSPAYVAGLLYLGLALFVLLVILGLTRYARGFVASASVLIGIVVGMAAAGAVGLVDLSRVATAPWFDVVRPFAFGAPTFVSSLRSAFS